MKRSITAILAFAVASLALVACSEGDTIIQPGGATTTGISVAGVGRVFAAPDVVVLRLGVDVERAVVADAREAAAAAMQKVVASLKANGIAEKDIQTAQFSVFPEYDYDTDDERPRLRGYRVTNVVTVRLRQIDSAGKAIDDAVQAGGNDAVVQGISFDIDDRTEQEAQAREKAMQQAKKRAQELARQGGVSLGDVVSISESTQAVPFYGRGYLPAPATGGGPVTEIEPGELEVVVVVQVLYAIK